MHSTDLGNDKTFKQQLKELKRDTKHIKVTQLVVEYWCRVDCLFQSDFIIPFGILQLIAIFNRNLFEFGFWNSEYTRVLEFNETHSKFSINSTDQRRVMLISKYGINAIETDVSKEVEESTFKIRINSKSDLREYIGVLSNPEIVNRTGARHWDKQAGVSVAYYSFGDVKQFESGKLKTREMTKQRWKHNSIIEFIIIPNREIRVKINNNKICTIHCNFSERLKEDGGTSCTLYPFVCVKVQQGSEFEVLD